MKGWYHSLIYITLFVALIVLGSSKAIAASDGTLGSTSEGRLDISLTITPLLMISNLNDFIFGSYSGTGDLVGQDDICVYRNDPAGEYRIVATSVEGRFAIAGPNGTVIPYNLFYNDERGTQGATELSYNTGSNTQTGANTSSATCFHGKVLNANVSVKLKEEHLQSVPSGAYTGTLILTVEPV